MIAVVWLLVLLCSSNNNPNLPENCNFPPLRENLPIFPFCQRMTRCHISYRSLCAVMSGVHLETSGCTGAWNGRINLNCSLEWATWILEKCWDFEEGISLDTSSIFWLCRAEICPCCVFCSRSFCLSLFSVNPLGSLLERDSSNALEDSS